MLSKLSPGSHSRINSCYHSVKLNNHFAIIFATWFLLQKVKMMAKTLTLRLSGPDSLVLDCLMMEYDQKTASKMLIKCMKDYSDMVNTIEALEKQVDSLTQKVGVRDQIIDNARSAAAVLLDRVGQQDLLD